MKQSEIVCPSPLVHEATFSMTAQHADHRATRPAREKHHLRRGGE